LPDPTTGAGQAADVEAIELHQLAGQVGLQMPLEWRRSTGRLGGRGVAGDQCQAATTGEEAMAMQHLEHAARRDHLATPHRQRQLRRHPPRPQARVPKAESHHPFF